MFVNCLMFLVSQGGNLYLDHWKASVDSRAGFSDKEKKSIMLSIVTKKGMTMTSMLIDW